MTTPLYRCTVDGYFGNVPRRAGNEFATVAWPERGMEPVNDEARRVSAYLNRHYHNPYRPHSPKDAFTDEIYLPATYPRQTGTGPARPDERDLEGAPRYRVRYAWTYRQAQADAGDVIVFLGWPTPDLNLEAVNEVAESIVAYYRANEKNQRLPFSPWCEFRQGPFLPKLPPIRMIFRDQEIDAVEHKAAANTRHTRRSLRRA